jgi:hypothetical protein
MMCGYSEGTKMNEAIVRLTAWVEGSSEAYSAHDQQFRDDLLSLLIDANRAFEQLDEIVAAAMEQERVNGNQRGLHASMRLTDALHFTPRPLRRRLVVVERNDDGEVVT